MKASSQKIFNILKTRLARNILLWILIFLFMLSKIDDKPAYPWVWYYLFICVCCLSLALVTYLNNLLLVPRFLAKKEYGIYFPLAMLLVFAFSFSFAALLKVLAIHFPGIQIDEISPIAVPVTREWDIDYTTEAGLLLNKIFIWVGVFTLIWYMNDHAEKEKEVAQTKKRQVESELNFLKSQINPHFLFNTLNNLYTLTIKKSDDAPEVVSKLSSILRYLLYESDIAEVSFDKEKEIMQAYIDLELLRLPKKENLHFCITADKPYNIPPLLWVTVLENVFKHGTRFISEEPYVDFRFVLENDYLMIYSKNTFKPNGVKDNLEKTGGIGMDNLQKRLRILFPGRYRMNVSQDNNYYITEIKIKL